MRRAAKAQHHTPEEIRQYVQDTLDVMEDLSLSDGLRIALGPTILTLVSSSQILFEQAAPGAMLLDGLRTPGH